jgi:hypothetical protein
LAPAPNPRVVSRPDLDLDIGQIAFEHLEIGVDGDELHTAQAGLDHAVDGIAAGAADADDLDPRGAGLTGCVEGEVHGALLVVAWGFG